MSPHAEQYGHRNGDLLYGLWHRFVSIKRHLQPRDAYAMTMVNLDALVIGAGVVSGGNLWAEACKYCERTLVIVETARDVGQPAKTCAITRRLAQDAGCAALCVLFTPNAREDDIAHFRAWQLVPQEEYWGELPPAGYATRLLRLRQTQAFARCMCGGP
jgi:hypothetical protein